MSVFGKLPSCDGSGQSEEMGFLIFQTEECNRLHIRAHPILSLFVHPTLNKHHSLSLSACEGLGDWCCFGAHRNGPSAHMKECQASRSRRLMSNLITCFTEKHHQTCLQTSAKANMKGLGMKRFGLSTQLKQTHFKNLAEQVQFFCINILSSNICPCLDMSVRIKKTATDKQQTYSKIISWKLLLLNPVKYSHNMPEQCCSICQTSYGHLYKKERHNAGG